MKKFSDASISGTDFWELPTDLVNYLMQEFEGSWEEENDVYPMLRFPIRRAEEITAFLRFIVPYELIDRHKRREIAVPIVEPKYGWLFVCDPETLRVDTRYLERLNEQKL